MIYFDSDVLFNYLVIQDITKHHQARSLINGAIESGSFGISTLVIQEVAYGMAREGIQAEEIESKLALFSGDLISVVREDILRGLAIAKSIGFKHINDCVHTAIAERNNCERFYTYNKSDFKRIKKHTDLLVSIL